MGRADGTGVLMGCHEPLAGGGGAVHSIGAVWCAANSCMPAGISRCSRLCYGLAGGLRNVVGPGEMRCDDLCTLAGGGTLGERVEGAYGDWLSAAVVAIVALAVLGE